MSGLGEIKRWVEANYDFGNWDNEGELYDAINKNEDWRNDLDDILLDEKPKFLDWLKSKIPTPIVKFNPETQIKVNGYSYVRNGKTINVKSYVRRRKI